MSSVNEVVNELVDTKFNRLKKCDNCDGSGEIVGLGGMKKKCGVCRYRWTCVIAIRKFTNWLLSNPFKTTPVGIAIAFFLFIAIFSPHDVNFLLASLGSIFVALKYKLDQASYQKSLFEERYIIFLKIDEILHNFINEEYKEKIDRQKYVKELDSIYRKSYLFYGDSTYQFIDKFRHAISACVYNSEGAKQQHEFLMSLIDGQNLSKSFPELKIDFY